MKFYAVFLIVFWSQLSFAQLRREFIKIPAAEYTIGSKQYLENPLRKVYSHGFEISAYELTNAEFDLFVQATGYVTLAEKLKNAQVFEPGLEEFRWLADSTAYWRYPNGVSRGGVQDKMNHPVTCICYRDALAYCEWADVRLPSLEEWEIATKAGSTSRYFDEVDLTSIGLYANIWHLKDHLRADTTDGYIYTSPVGSFKPNPWGLYDVFGNVFEFCEGELLRDEGRKVAHARGGSWWCSKSSCAAFNSVYIGSVNPSASFSNLGFRIARDLISPAASTHISSPK